MPLGDRAVLEAFLTQLQPALAVEIGTAQGGSLERIAAHSSAVHAFDLSGDLLLERPPNVELHVGDSRVLVPEVLERIAHAGARVDFALVDGDHSSAGVRADLEALLASPAVESAVILAHDSFNPAVRAGIEAVAAAHPKVSGFDLDLIPGRLISSGPLAGQLWGGFALFLVGDPAPGRLPEIQTRIPPMDPITLEFLDSHEALRRGPTALGERGGRGVGPSAELDRLRRELASVRASLSWRLTRPLRALKARGADRR